MQYYIAFREIKSKLKEKIISKKEVVAYGKTSTGTSGISPIDSEEIFDDFKPFQKRLKELGFKVTEKDF